MPAFEDKTLKITRSPTKSTDTMDDLQEKAGRQTRLGQPRRAPSRLPARHSLLLL